MELPLRSPSKRPKLMFVLGLPPTKIGGIERYLRNFASTLNSAGWDSVLCFDGPITQEFREYFCGPFITIERLDNQQGLGLACAGDLWKVLRKHRPQVFVYAFHSVMRCFPWLARFAGCKRIFYNDHSSRPFGLRAAPLRISRRIAGRILTMPLTAIVSVADFTRRTGTAFGTSSATNYLVRNGVEVRPVDPKLRASIRERLGIAKQDLVIMQVCHMIQVKGVEIMLAAANLLLKKHSGIRILLVGNGPELEKYRRLAAELGIEDAVIFAGLVSNPTDTGVFDAADIYCQPSIWQEACPLAVLEAMSFGLPVIASNTGGIPEIVRDKQSGILVPVGDVRELCHAMERLAGNPELRRRMGREGVRLVVNGHMLTDTTRKYVDLFLGRGQAMPSAESEAADPLPAGARQAS